MRRLCRETWLTGAFLLLTAVAAWSASPSEIGAYLEQLDAGSQPAIAGELLLSSSELSEFYRARRHQPVWTRGFGRRARLAELVQEIEASAEHGLSPGHYHLALLSAGDDTSLSTELLATDAFLTQAIHRGNGVLSPKKLDQDWHLSQSEIHAAEVLEQAIEDNSIGEALAGLWPKHEDYRRLLEKRRTILSAGPTDDLVVPAGSTLSYGRSSPRIITLKQRLLGPGAYTPEFDHRLRDAVLAFQAAVGVAPDGIVGEATLAMINAPRSFWLNTLDANLERWRWLPNALPSRYLMVNTAGFELRAVDDGQEVIRTRVIVGQTYRSTPMFTETLKYLVYNPIWNVPLKIAARDKLPQLKREPIRLALQGFEARKAGTDHFVPVDTIDWRDVTSENFPYDLRQLPGPTNALGRIKFMLPNRFAVYLHDTPDRGLFDQPERDFSSGCIRLADPLMLTDWILRHDGQADAAAAMQAQIDSGEGRIVYLETPLPVLVVYFTAFVSGTGEVVFRRDLYQQDQVIVTAFQGLKPVRQEDVEGG